MGRRQAAKSVCHSVRAERQQRTARSIGVSSCTAAPHRRVSPHSSANIRSAFIVISFFRYLLPFITLFVLLSPSLRFLCLISATCYSVLTSQHDLTPVTRITVNYHNHTRLHSSQHGTQSLNRLHNWSVGTEVTLSQFRLPPDSIQ